jgi:hypothetical protein
MSTIKVIFVLIYIAMRGVIESDIGVNRNASDYWTQKLCC